MDSPHRKDPERQRLGRLGALTVHARGRTNTTPAREAWEANVAAEFGIGEDLDPAERARRMDAAVRVRMTKLARTRWANKKPSTVTETSVEGGGGDDRGVYPATR